MALDHPEAKVTARVGRSRWLSPIWAIPIVTALIAGFLVLHTWSQRGPTITITFHAAEGIVAGQSQLRYRDVVIGTVQEIALSPDLGHVVMTVRTTRAAEPLLTEHARFWVVKPRLFAGSISGLDTLLSGSYIQIAPALTATGEPERHFTGLEDPPLLTAQEPGRTFRLRADRIGSISLGSPIFYRDLEVGQVMGWDLADMAQSVTIHAFILAPFDRYVREGSRFWNASGVSLRLGAEGVQLQLESVRALLLGGIAFETPEAALTGADVARDTVFRLYASQEAATSAAITRRIPVVSYFTDSITGLAPGAPVTFQGVRIGEVLGYDLVYDPETDRLRVPVRYEIEPERVAGSIHARSRGVLENARLLVHQGMRARLMSANLITGQQQIALEMVENAAPAEIRMEGDVIVMDAGGEVTHALMGEMMLDYARRRGVVGFVLNGAIRDADAFLEMNVPSFAVGVTHRGPYKNGPGEINCHIAIGGMVIMPGDLVLGDADGVVVVPIDDVAEVYERTVAKHTAENKQMDNIKDGTHKPTWFNDALAKAGCELPSES